MRWDEFEMKEKNELQMEEKAAVPERRRLHDESRRITSKSAIKMCIKMSKNIYLHKVGHERMRQQLTEKEREGQRGQSEKLYNTILYILEYIERCTASGEQKLFGVAKVLAAYTFSPTRALSRMHSSHA